MVHILKNEDVESYSLQYQQQRQNDNARPERQKNKDAAETGSLNSNRSLLPKDHADLSQGSNSAQNLPKKKTLPNGESSSHQKRSNEKASKGILKNTYMHDPDHREPDDYQKRKTNQVKPMYDDGFFYQGLENDRGGPSLEDHLTMKDHVVISETVEIIKRNSNHNGANSHGARNPEFLNSLQSQQNFSKHADEIHTKIKKNINNDVFSPVYLKEIDQQVNFEKVPSDLPEITSTT